MLEYGNKVFGYDERVLNEREARAAAGILFGFGIITVMNSVILGNGILSRVYLAFFTFDFLLRITFPNYSPSLLLGRFFVKNQKPEYVSANQKRFAWAVGFILSVPMFYYLSWHWEPDTYKVLVCIFCLALLFMESVFSFCLGCWAYKNFLHRKTKNCPGGACELEIKEKVQTFNRAQKLITLITGLFVISISYYYFYKIPNKTYFGEGLSQLLMTKSQIQAEQDVAFEKAVKEEFENDNF